MRLEGKKAGSDERDERQGESEGVREHIYLNSKGE